MGNCLLGGMSDPEEVIKVIKSNGSIMEFYPPITVNFITNEFPNQAIFANQDPFSKPLNQFDELVAGQSYYLLPLNNQAEHLPASASRNDKIVVRHGHLRSLSVPINPSYSAPYRMSLDYQHYQGVGLIKRTSTEPFTCRTSGSASRRRMFWKVKLVITPEQLLKILSQEASTKELIESVRIVAKSGVSAGVVSDQWSLSSSGRTASSKIDSLVLD